MQQKDEMYSSSWMIFNCVLREIDDFSNLDGWNFHLSRCESKTEHCHMNYDSCFQDFSDNVFFLFVKLNRLYSKTNAYYQIFFKINDSLRNKTFIFKRKLFLFNNMRLQSQVKQDTLLLGQPFKQPSRYPINISHYRAVYSNFKEYCIHLPLIQFQCKINHLVLHIQTIYSLIFVII